MRRSDSLAVIAALGIALWTSDPLLAAEDWPQFRGTDGQGHSLERGLPIEWSETQNVRWKTPVPGAGWSSPVVANGQVWLTTAVEAPGERGSRAALSLRALSFDVNSGRKLVDVELFRLTRLRPLNPKNTFASPTPILDGDRVYVHFGADGTAALTTQGEVVWRIRLPYESQHGGGGSPTLHGELLIINSDGNGDEAFVVALDVRTGRERWRRPRRTPFDQAYSTPLVIRVGSRDQVISVGAYRAISYDPSNGQEIWRVSYEPGFSNVPRPVFGNGLVYIATGFQEPTLIAVRPNGEGDVTRTHIAWTLRRGAPLTPSPLLVGDELYVPSDNGILTCVDARTGAVHYQQRLGGNIAASPISADGHIYLLNEDGATTVISPGTTFQRLAVNRLDGGALASIAVSGGSLFIRTDRDLYRIGASGP
jgi:outer membrane protein assembly factor BamB